MTEEVYKPQGCLVIIKFMFNAVYLYSCLNDFF